MNIVLVPPDGLRAVWQAVRDGLDKMPAEDWIAEDVYHAIKSGNAALYMAVSEVGYQGFMVLTKRHTEFTNQPYLHVWLAHNVGGADVMTAGEQEIKQAAQRMGATRITFGSPRLGWSKRYPLVSATYEIK